jgi:hypothetical protein
MLVGFVVTKKNPADLHFRQGKQASAGLERILSGLNTFCASVEKAAKAFGQVSWLRERSSQHSGATARDSHPLPYSPLSGAPKRLMEKIVSKRAAHYHVIKTVVNLRPGSEFKL